MSTPTLAPARSLLDLRPSRAEDAAHPALRPLRARGQAEFEAAGFPEVHDEAWRFTSLKKLSRANWVYSTPPAAPDAPLHLSLIGEVPERLVFVDGVYNADRSTATQSNGGIHFLPLAQALEDSDVAAQLDTVVSHERHRFAALNSAFLQQGGVVVIPRGAQPTKPVHLLFLSTAAGEARFQPVRVLVLAGEGAEAAVVEEYVGEPGASYFTNVVTEVVLEAGAVLDHTRIQHESEQAYHLGILAATVGRDAVFTNHALALGGGLARLDLDVSLAGEGASCTLNGLYLTTGRQHIDHHTYMDHVKPHTQSRQLYKGVLDGKSIAVFNGRVLVREDSQKIETAQTNNNLLLSEEALVNTNPELEIFADDVKAQHGATIGQIEDEQLFYLRSRGIDEKAARHLLIQAFAGQMIDRLASMPLRNALHAYLERRF